MILTEGWRDSFADTPGLAAQLAPQVLCGAGAGIMGGLLAGGYSGALFFGALGAITATIFNWKQVKDDLRDLAPGASRSSPRRGDRRTLSRRV
jgi:hypothetical protein